VLTIYSKSISIKKIVEANKNDKLAIFIGAGVSKSSETDKIIIPEWNDIIEKLKKISGEDAFQLGPLIFRRASRGRTL